MPLIPSILQKYGFKFILPIVIVILCLLFYFFKQDNTNSLQTNVIETIPKTKQQDAQSPEPPKDIEQQPQHVMVDVKGAVKIPGVYILPFDSRIIDAIQMAGGYADGAESRSINHAQKVQDEMILYVPMIGEEPPTQATTTTGQASVPSSNSKGKVNLNKADEAELATLPGIGPSKAKAILTHRDKNGPFKSIEDLKQVTGIGDKTFEKLKDAISVN